MEKLKSHIIIGVLAILGVANVNAQGTSTAVMEIRVEVVSGSAVNLNDQIFEMNNCNESKQFVAQGVNEITITIPDGSEIMTEFDEVVDMKNGTGSFEMITTAKKKENGASVTYSFDTNSGGQQVAAGMYSGRQKATIQYL